jgi:hypothetical protein
MNSPNQEQPQISQGVLCPGGTPLYLGRTNEPVNSLNSQNLPLLWMDILTVRCISGFCMVGPSFWPRFHCKESNQTRKKIVQCHSVHKES